MSMLGLSDGSTVRASRAPVSKNRVRTSLRLLATTSWSTARPIRLAYHPASTLPKFPVGTVNDTGRPSGATARAAVT